jgi:hypothetical protein
MQYDVIVKIICISKIVTYLKNEAKLDSFGKVSHLVNLNFLYNVIIKNGVKFRCISMYFK